MMNFSVLTKLNSLQALLPILAVTLAALFWSGNFIAGKYLHNAIDPIALNTLRWCICMIIFLPFVFNSIYRQRHVIRREWKFIFCLGITGIASFHTLVYYSLTHISAINALLLLSLSPVLILLSSMLFTQRKIRFEQWIGTAVSLFGVCFLISKGSINSLIELQFNSGDLWMLGAVIIWTVYSLILKQRPMDLSQEVTLAMSIVSALLVLLPLSIVYADFTATIFTIDLLFAIAYIAIFSSFIAFLLWSYGVSELGPEISGQFLHLMPVFGAILAVLILDENIFLTQVIGAFFVFLGIYWVSNNDLIRKSKKVC